MFDVASNSVAGFNLSHSVHRYSLETPDALALASEGIELTYGQLAQRAASLAAALKSSPVWDRRGSDRPRVAILASRSIDACIATLGACWAGATYVPISLKSPEDRIVRLLTRYQFAAVIADNQGTKLLTERVVAVCPPLIVVPEAGLNRCASAAARIDVRVLDEVVKTPAAIPPASFDADDLAYIIFTSGTTGEPKGVMISHNAAHHFIEMAVAYFKLRPDDRVLEACELSFDVSVQNMFSTWRAGASVHVLPANRVMNAVKIAREARLTVWSSVPSLAGMLNQIKALKPDALPDLRLSAFAGEQLPLNTVLAWQRAAPNGDILNMYGPTEATVVCVGQRVDTTTMSQDASGLAPIGSSLPGITAAILSLDRTPVRDGEQGELAISGVQLAEGYLDAPELTAAKFPTIEGQRWYLTGDRAVRDADGVIHHLGRIDNQIKILGQRVELEEIDTQLRSAAGADLVATVAWPIVDGSVQGVVSFVGAGVVDQQQLLAILKARLPSYMVPSRIFAVENMPLNASGKVDRAALLEWVRSGALQ